MPLRIVMTADEALVSDEATDALRRALRQDGHAILLVPSFAQALQVQQGLSEEVGLSLGLTTTTPNGWVNERWEVWGDGRALVGPVERLVLMRLALRDVAGSLAPTTGTLDALVKIARSSLPWAKTSEARALAASVGVVLSAGELDVCAVLDRYAQLLATRGLVERAEAEVALAEAMPHTDSVVVCGFARLPRSQRKLLLAQAKARQVQLNLAVRDEGAVAFVELLQAEAQAAGVEFELVTEAEAASTSDDELAVLARTVFASGPVRSAVSSQGMVRLLEPAGPLAEGELLAQEVVRLAEEGATRVVVAVPDVEAAWRRLGARLATRELSVRCTVRRSASDDTTIKAFLGFAQTVARLAELAETWPGPIEGLAGPEPQLGDMSWWPPRQLTDFLLSSASLVAPERAWELDAKWRSNRVLTPMLVLEQLQREGLTSKSVAQATAAILRGRVGTAALQLARALADSDSTAFKEEIVALGSIQDAARTIGALGVSASRKKDVQVTMGLSELVALIAEVSLHESINSRLVLGDESASCSVRICSRSEAATLPARSADALIVCGLTSAEWPLAAADDAGVAFLEHVGLLEDEPPLVVARRQFRGMLAVPTKVLVLEQALHDDAAQPTYPAVMLSEVFACYGEKPSLPTATLGENRPDRLLSSSGKEPCLRESLPSAPSGEVGPEVADMVIVPREGRDDVGVLSLSASQIESYLECPYKWFTLRRLGLGDSDATFSPMQMGSFVHRVLEVSRRMLMQQAAQEAGLVAPGELVDLEGTEISYIPGSGVTAENLALAQSLVNTEYDYHLAHQRQKATTLAAQSLVPHSATEEYRLALLREDLLSEVAFEVGRFRGFEPRYFELRFGGSGEKAHHVQYAGIDFVGTIDRVDVDAHGRAVVIDYKHKLAGGFASEYDAFADGAPTSANEFVLPRRVQSLIYAQVVRRMYPDLKVVGAVYLSTQGGRRKQHEIAGVLDAGAADMVMGTGLSDRRWSHLVVGGLGKMTFEELLDETERRIAEKVALLVQGHIGAEPLDDKACQWCPVANCKRRVG